MSQPFRTPHGGHVDRSTTLTFTFDGEHHTGHRGDTLASALLANGIHLVGRSLKYHRPRGILTAGPEEPNALVRLGSGARAVPNVKATEVALFEGLQAESQRGWPSARIDLGAAADRLSRFLPPGFYYKTFMRPRWLWPQYEHVLRRAASSARPPRGSDPDRYDKRHAHCDVLVVGAGPAGLAAALAATRAGARVVLADEHPILGGSLLDHEVSLDAAPAPDWLGAVRTELEAAQRTTLLRRTTVFGRYLHGRFGAVQHLGTGVGRQRYWQIRADRVVLAAGALERPLVFADNDRPGIMLASAVRRYVRRFGVAPGRRAVIVTNNDTPYGVVPTMLEAGIDVRALVDVRATSDADPGDVPVLDRARVSRVRGRRHVEGVEIVRDTDRHAIACDLVVVSGGWTPTIHLHAQGGDEAVYDEAWGAFVPAPADDASTVTTAGACRGTQGLGAILEDGQRAGAHAAGATGHRAEGTHRAPSAQPASAMLPVDAAGAPSPAGHGKAFIDLQTDVTVRDVEVALQEGYTSVEHVKRYTTLGMGTDQGKTGNVNAMHVVAERRARPAREIGTTTARPPYAPITLGALAARETGPRLAPVRRSPMHDWHERNGAVFMPTGPWLRPKYFRDGGNDVVAAASREAGNVRNNVGLADVSTLGKIVLQGPDVPTFLDRIYINRWMKLEVGRARYGVMLREDGYVFDDGTTTRLDDDRFLMTTTTANAGAVLAHLEFYLQQVWPELEVRATSVTDQWAVVALAGPRSREVLARLFPGADVTDEGLPFLGVVETELDGLSTRVSRISFSGELAYEIAVPADAGQALWETLLDVGQPLGIAPYGLEAMDYLRIEKGHLVVGMDIDGRVSPYDVGLGGMCKTERDFVGRRSLEKPAFQDEDRRRLAGFDSVDGRTMIAAGAQLVKEPFDGTPQPSLGRITSRAYSPVLGRPIALGLIAGGAGSYDAPVHAVAPLTGEHAVVEVVAPTFYDPAGERMRG